MLYSARANDNFGMISLEEARLLIAKNCPPPAGPVSLPLSDSLGHALAEEVRAEEDAPPFDRAMMDGFAVRAADTSRTPVRLHVVGESRAGRPFRGRVSAGEGAAILTGAPVPEGADAVVPVEKTKPGEGGAVELQEAVKAGDHIARRGEDVRAGDLLLPPGTPIRPQELAVLAASGRARVRVVPVPAVSILPTGDELVPPERRPEFGQIRESNSYGLEAQARRRGFPPRRLPIAPDDPKKLREALERALAEGSCLLVSGGISVGTHDYVAGALAHLGAVQHFHGVSVKPGKPVWFGTLGRKAIFGLPGNPVSSFVIFELLVRPCLERMAGFPESRPERRGRFRGGPVGRNRRPQFVPALFREGAEDAEVEALPWKSSGDFYELARANALLRVPPEESPAPGSIVEFLPV